MDKLSIKMNELVKREYLGSTKKSKLSPNITNDKGIVNKFIRSRAAYRQWVRFYASKEVSKAVSPETRATIENIKKAKFDYKKIPDLMKRVKETVDSGIIPVEKDRINPAYDNTIYSIYLDAVKVLSDTKLSVAVNRWNEELLKVTGKGALTKKVIKENTQSIYQYSFLITAYTSIIMLVQHLTIQLATCATELSDSLDTDSLLDHYYMSFLPNFKNVVLKHVKVIRYFLENPVADIEKELKINYNTELSKESYSYYDYLYTSSVNRYSLEFGGAILIALGIGLGLITIIPAIQAVIYYWGTCRIAAGQKMKDDAQFLNYNIAQLRRKMANSKNPNEVAKLRSVIEKQEKEVAKLNAKASKLCLDYEEYESDSAYIEEMDVKSEDDMHYRFDREDQLATETPVVQEEKPYDSSGSGSPTIFI